jgi:hypothetical protein
MAASKKIKGWVNRQEYLPQALPNGWINIEEFTAKPQKTIGLRVGQHPGIVGLHEQEATLNLSRPEKTLLYNWLLF